MALQIKKKTSETIFPAEDIPLFRNKIVNQLYRQLYLRGVDHDQILINITGYHQSVV